MPSHAANTLSVTHRVAGIVSVGDELTLGQTLDTNARWVAQRLTDAGLVTIEHVTVPDDRDAHVAAFRRLAKHADLIVCTGGLGPTADDLTREALAEAMDDHLVEDAIALAQIESFYAARNRTMNASNRAQAFRPSRGTTLANHNGTAPGLYGQVVSQVDGTTGNREHACDVFCLPGPPREMFPMFEQHVLARLSLPPGRTVRTRVLHTFGLAESELAHRLGKLMDRDAIARGRPMVGTTASGGVVSVRLRYEGAATPETAAGLLDECERQVRDAAGVYVFGAASDTLASVSLAMLRQAGQKLGVVESCTGGLLGSMLTEVPGSSAAFAGGFVTYTNALKTSLAGVPAANFAPGAPGAVSRETAEAMAVGGLRALGVEHALAITGIAGPDGATPGKPVGLVWIARASVARSSPTSTAPDIDCRAFQMTGDRASVREWAARTALAMLWQHLAGVPAMKLLRQV
jgi:nicotinamide-nucleotide amidase